MLRIFHSFLFKLILTVIISVFIGFQIERFIPDSPEIELKEAQHSFRKILNAKPSVALDNKLQQQLEGYLSDKTGDYSVLVVDLLPEGKRNVCIRCDESFEAASLYKLFLMAAAYQAVYDGKLSLDTEISAKMSHLTDVYGSVDFGYESFSDTEVISYSIQESLERIASISDNFAALMLAEKIGWGSVQSVADEIGAEQTSIQSPITTSPRDIGLLMQKLYKGEIVSLEASEHILDMLTKSKLNNRIPAKLPKWDPSTGKGLRIAHKTGELSGVRNDAGVVFLDGNPYVIVLMSKNIKGEDEGVENLAEMSGLVYQYYASNSAADKVK